MISTYVPFFSPVARWTAKVMFHVSPPAGAKWSFGTASVTHSNVVRHGSFDTTV